MTWKLSFVANSRLIWSHRRSRKSRVLTTRRRFTVMTTVGIVLVVGIESEIPAQNCVQVDGHLVRVESGDATCSSDVARDDTTRITLRVSLHSGRLCWFQGFRTFFEDCVSFRWSRPCLAMDLLFQMLDFVFQSRERVQRNWFCQELYIAALAGSILSVSG